MVRLRDEPSPDLFATHTGRTMDAAYPVLDWWLRTASNPWQSLEGGCGEVPPRACVDCCARSDGCWRRQCINADNHCLELRHLRDTPDRVARAPGDLANHHEHRAGNAGCSAFRRAAGHIASGARRSRWPSGMPRRELGASRCRKTTAASGRSQASWSAGICVSGSREVAGGLCHLLRVLSPGTPRDLGDPAPSPCCAAGELKSPTNRPVFRVGMPSGLSAITRSWPCRNTHAVG